MPEFMDVVRAQRACRAFTGEPVDDGVLAQVLEAATFAPSAENRQPWVFLVLRDEDQRRAIGELNRRAWEQGARKYSEQRLSPQLLDEVDRGVAGGVDSAPVIVVVCGDTRIGNPKVIEASVFPAVQNLLLAANALGLASALTTLPLVFADEVALLLALPSEVRPLAVVPLGHPQRRMGPPRRAPFSEKAYRDHFGVAW
ncbi:MAG: nitroreductase family protein [Acidimicrobiales bacterium]